MGAGGRRRQASAVAGWPVVALVVVLLGLLSALVVAAGPAELGRPRLGAIEGTPFPDVVIEEDGAPGQEPDEAGERPGLPGWALVVAWAVGLTLVGLLVLRSLRRADPGAEPTGEEPSDGGDGDGGRVHHLGELRDLARCAVGDLRDLPADRVADVVVLAWERLEAAATLVGSARPPHRTPTEFTADLLQRNGARPDATVDLLRLYHRARFSSAPLPPDAGATAMAAFAAVAASIGPPDDDPVARRTPVGD